MLPSLFLGVGGVVGLRLLVSSNGRIPKEKFTTPHVSKVKTVKFLRPYLLVLTRLKPPGQSPK